MISKLSLSHRLSTRALTDTLDGQPLFEALRSDWTWRKTRREFIRLQPVCQLCGRDDHLAVHHALPWAVAEHLRYDQHNLVTLCTSCHLRFGHLNNWRDYNPLIFKLVQMVQACHPRSTDWGTAVDQRWLDDQIMAQPWPGQE